MEQQGPAYLTTGQFAPHALGRRDRPDAVQNARHQAYDMRMQSSREQHNKVRRPIWEPPNMNDSMRNPLPSPQPLMFPSSFALRWFIRKWSSKRVKSVKSWTPQRVLNLTCGSFWFARVKTWERRRNSLQTLTDWNTHTHWPHFLHCNIKNSVVD